MIRSTVAFVCFALVATVVSPALAQAPVKHRAGLKTVVRSLNLTAAQKASVKDAIKAHRADLHTARANGDRPSIQQARRATFQDVLKVLTPEQREQVKAQAKKKLRDQ